MVLKGACTSDASRYWLKAQWKARQTLWGQLTKYSESLDEGLMARLESSRFYHGGAVLFLKSFTHLNYNPTGTVISLTTCVGMMASTARECQ
jgi:hypothetical protein